MDSHANRPGYDIGEVLNRCRNEIVADLSFNVTMDHMITKGVFTDVEVHEITDLVRDSDKVRELVKLIKNKGSDAYAAFMEALSTTKQEHLRKKIKTEEDKVPSNTEHAPVPESIQESIPQRTPKCTQESISQSHVIGEVLNRCRKEIVASLSFNVAMDHIITKGVFTDVEVHEITDLVKNAEKVRELVKLIKNKGDKAYAAFLEALSTTKQEHLLGIIKTEQDKVFSDVEHAPVPESTPQSKPKSTPQSDPSNNRGLRQQVEDGESTASDGNVSSTGHTGGGSISEVDNVSVTPDTSTQDGGFKDINNISVNEKPKLHLQA